MPYYPSVDISLNKISVNGILHDCTNGIMHWNLFNLDPVPILRIGFHLEATIFDSTLGDDLDNSLIWLFQPYSDGTAKVRIKIDSLDVADLESEFDISYSHAGATFDNSITFERTRTDQSIPVSIPTDVPDPQKTVYPLFGNDSTIYGKDWTEKINNRYTLPPQDPGPYLGDGGYNIDHWLGDHLYNSQFKKKTLEDDYMTIKLLAVNHPDYVEQRVVDACNNMLINIHYPTKYAYPNDLIYLNEHKYSIDKFIGLDPLSN